MFTMYAMMLYVHKIAGQVRGDRLSATTVVATNRYHSVCECQPILTAKCMSSAAFAPEIYFMSDSKTPTISSTVHNLLPLYLNAFLVG
jgi:hypothetical protein